MVNPAIPFFGIKRQYANIRDELLAATDAVYTSGRVLDGDYTIAFERAIGARCNRKYAVAVGSGTQGLVFAQQALFTTPAKILIPTISFVATLNAVVMNGNEPVFCDTDNKALMDLESLDFALKGSGVEGIMYVNIFGNTVDYDRFRVNTEFFNQDLKIIEDAAQSFGASYKGIPSGSMGDISVLSFDPTKNLNNYGSGGMVLTDDVDIARIVLNLRDNGKWSGHDIPGTNSKMSEADCAGMMVKLNHFDSWQRRRTMIAEYYTQELKDIVDVPQVTEGTTHSWHKYVVLCEDRLRLKQILADAGVEAKIHYDTPLYDYPVGYNYINYASDLYREASVFCSECLSLPIYPELTDAEVERVVNAVKQYKY